MNNEIFISEKCEIFLMIPNSEWNEIFTIELLNFKLFEKDVEISQPKTVIIIHEDMNFTMKILK